MSSSLKQVSRRRVLVHVAGATTLGICVAIAVGVGAIRMFTDVDPGPAMAAIRPLWLLAAVGVFVFGNLLVGHRFVAMLPPRESGPLGGFEVGSLFFASSVFSLLLPGPVGEVAAVAALKKRYNLPLRVGFATTVHARFVGLAAAAVIGALALPFVDVDGTVGAVLVAGAGLLILGGLVLGLLSMQPRGLVNLGERLVAWSDRPGLLGRVFGSVRLFARSLAQVGKADARTWSRVFGWSLVIQLVQMGALICLCLALDLRPAWPGLFLAQGTGSLAILVGVFLPGGLGTYELAFVGSMVGAGGLSVAAAGTLIVAVRVVHLLAIACAGLIFAGWAHVFLSEEVVSSLDTVALEGQG
jgi:uncharacterized membrane protein YbhN (UPF0104 family)